MPSIEDVRTIKVHAVATGRLCSTAEQRATSGSVIAKFILHVRYRDTIWLQHPKKRLTNKNDPQQAVAYTYQPPRKRTGYIRRWWDNALVEQYNWQRHLFYLLLLTAMRQHTGIGKAMTISSSQRSNDHIVCVESYTWCAKSNSGTGTMLLWLLLLS